MTDIELALRVFIVDDEPPARSRLRDLLNDCSEQLDLEVVGEAGNGVEALNKLAEIAAEAMTSLPQVLVNVRVAQRMPDIADRLAAEIAAAQRDLGDTGRILVRASGTEPLVRVMVEAPTAEHARHVADALAEAARRLAR